MSPVLAHGAAPSTAPGVPAVTRALSLLDLLAAERMPMTPTRLAERLQLPKSSVHGLCNTLAARGYLRREEDGRYFIGPGVMSLANAFTGHTSVAREFASLWPDLAAAPEETVILSVLDGTDIVYVATRPGERPLSLAFSVGMRLPAHLAASGKAMLAWHDPAFVRGLYPDGKLPFFRGRRAGTLKALFDELATARERGYSVDDEGVREGVFCFGAPVFGPAGTPIAGVGACVQKALWASRRGGVHLDGVVEIARLLTRRLGGLVPPPPA
ncbi:IclR family transcriptional regulator [Aquabacterium sp. J223]|uniref:IclR family transcriptional regulator n=1 Tax=Aquabacterium sp. J223 TaxID=2898431 RepID=UPI0021AD6D58|nr:IclR family transcriptional regulator [Aquabacterium sp. J223]UUX96332.1 IclR family transcriptional regulator [Aquabacterium sp. J223]